MQPVADKCVLSDMSIQVIQVIQTWFVYNNKYQASTWTPYDLIRFKEFIIDIVVFPILVQMNGIN
jgi:hypothetical protein